MIHEGTISIRHRNRSLVIIVEIKPIEKQKRVHVGQTDENLTVPGTAAPDRDVVLPDEKFGERVRSKTSCVVPRGRICVAFPRSEFEILSGSVVGAEGHFG